MPLQPQQACRIDLAFIPAAGGGLRSAAVQVDHDWVDGLAALALIGTAVTATAPPSTPAGNPTAAGAGGALGFGAVLCLALLARFGRRTAAFLGWGPD